MGIVVCSDGRSNLNEDRRASEDDISKYAHCTSLVFAPRCVDQASKFRPADELSLAIQCGIRISEMMLDIMGVEQTQMRLPCLKGEGGRRRRRAAFGRRSSVKNADAQRRLWWGCRRYPD
jgi:hypothetical protein